MFVSHRWITPEHPDPAGAQLRELRRRLAVLAARNPSFAEALVFYDYCSIVQKPHTAAERADFERDLRSLVALCRSAAKVLVLSEGYAAYKYRAWCFLELVISEQNVYLFDDQEQIAAELAFRDTLRWEDRDTNFVVDSYFFRYKVDRLEVEPIVASFQHFALCRATDKQDIPLIKAELVRHFNTRTMTPFAQLVTAIAKFFDIEFVLGADSGFVPCQPYFDEEQWVRLPGERRTAAPRTGRFEDLDFTSPVLKQSRFSVPQSQVDALKRDGFTMLLHLTAPSIRDYVGFMKQCSRDPKWKSYYVPALATFRARGHEKDSFPSLDHVMHTLIESIPGIGAGPAGIYVPIAHA